ncbi:MAG: hypothetical protein JSU91_05965, partial [Thermoplasmatales archaeon]
MEKRYNFFYKKWNTLIIALFLIMVSFSSISLAFDVDFENEIKLSYNFENPKIQSVEIAGTNYDRITLSTCIADGNVGEPLLPSKGVYILLPPKTKAHFIEVLSNEKQNLGTGFFIEPMGKPIPLSSVQTNVVPTPDEKIYASNEFYPGKLHTKVGLYNFRGYQILILLLHPVQYNPSTGELFYYSSLDVNIELVNDEKANNLFRGFERDRIEVIKKVDNPEIAISYSDEFKSSKDVFELLILTSDSFKDGFNPLKEIHETSGTPTVIRTLADVGSSDLEDIRDYIRDAYNNLGIEYVLIGGDDNIIPAPILWVEGLDEETWHYETYMPSDLYYACLDGPYNYDG